MTLEAIPAWKVPTLTTAVSPGGTLRATMKRYFSVTAGERNRKLVFTPVFTCQTCEPPPAPPLTA